MLPKGTFNLWMRFGLSTTSGVHGQWRDIFMKFSIKAQKSDGEAMKRKCRKRGKNFLLAKSMQFIWANPLIKPRSNHGAQHLDHKLLMLSLMMKPYPFHNIFHKWKTVRWSTSQQHAMHIILAKWPLIRPWIWWPKKKTHQDKIGKFLLKK